ncbi:MAG TPA: hypothetical protein VHO03_05935, partial [Ignavibacteriales bacterium]|nr:hypothetical protein [Ignavibacteriales bacterium]
MGDLPSTVTTYYNLGKWNAGNNPSSSGLNGNWDKIDQTLHDIATGLSETSGSIGNWSGSPVGLDAAMGRRSLGLDNIANIGTGAVSTAEFNYLQGLTGNIQTQLNTLNADRHTHPNIAELNSVDQNLSKLNSV